MIILLGLLIVIIIGIVVITMQLLKRRVKIFSKSFFLTFILTIIIPGIILTFFLFALSCMGGCSVEKHTPKWFFTMNFSKIGNMPIIQPVSGVQYFYDTDLGERREITYESKSQLNEIQKEIENYLTGKKVQINSNSSCYNGYWDFNDETVVIRCESKSKCIMIYLDEKDTYVLVRALEMN